MMDFSEYQKLAITTAVYPRVFVEKEDGTLQEANYIYPSLGLGGETGEGIEKVKKLIRDRRGVIDAETCLAIKKELGDVLWYIAALCKEFGLDMNDVAKGNIEKLSSRQNRGTLQGSGDDR